MSTAPEPIAPYVIHPGVKDYATPTQAAYIDAVNEHGGYRAAARVVDRDHATVFRSCQVAIAKAVHAGYAPDHGLERPLPLGLSLKGTSVLRDPQTGVDKLIWIKSTRDDKLREEMVRAAIDALTQEIVRAVPVDAPVNAAAHLANLITVTDYHVGMLAWGQEAGADWDLQIAERTLDGAVDHLIAACPKARLGILLNLGDFIHFDGLQAITPTSGHALDAAARFPAIVAVAVRVLRRAVALMLATHERVIVVMAEGNHDIVSSVWLRHLFALLFENEPRVQVLDSPLPYYAIEHGSTFLGFHHGHLKRNDDLPALFAAQFREMWGRTARGYIHTGHRHHVEEKEYPGAKVIQHPTLAARDAYAARGGWISEREMTAITYHSTFGQVARATVTAEMLTPLH